MTARRDRRVGRGQADGARRLIASRMSISTPPDLASALRCASILFPESIANDCENRTPSERAEC
jgi:hypothetical protein